MVRHGIVILLLMATVRKNFANMESLEDVLVYPLEPPSKIQKRETLGSNADFIEFIQEKLIQHSQALEQLMKIVQTNEELSKQLVENFVKNSEMPKMPEKVEVHPETRRSRNGIIEEKEHALFRISRNLPKYAILLKNIILQEFESDTDPTPLVELVTESKSTQLLSRRSMDDPPKAEAALEDNNKISPWCSVAMVCNRTLNPVCGFDDNFGFGKFDDVCHMFTVNCYWKYNFAMVPSCNPTA